MGTTLAGAFALIVGGVGCVGFVAPARAAEVDVKTLFSQADQNGGVRRLSLKLGPLTVEDVVFDVTRRGNGTVSIPSLTLKLFDQHDDGLVYRDGVLRLDAVQMYRDAPLSLIVSGIVRRTGEKENGPVTDEAITFVYYLDCKEGRFERAFGTSSWEIIELKPVNTDKISCN